MCALLKFLRANKIRRKFCTSSVMNQLNYLLRHSTLQQRRSWWKMVESWMF